MAEGGNDITLISLGSCGQVSPSNINITIYELSLKKIISFINTHQKIRTLIKHIQPDVVHSHMIHDNIISRLLRDTLNMAFLISSAHSNNDGGLASIVSYGITDRLSNISTNVS
ncbi:glycosyltransferase [Buttiauxella ferragutiae]|uniref:glycosyltransferase n=1 Tax=Buttiauxella ferragutiae TaxID=82989 RepID=UPI003525753F